MTKGMSAMMAKLKGESQDTPTEGSMKKATKKKAGKKARCASCA